MQCAGAEVGPQSYSELSSSLQIYCSVGLQSSSALLPSPARPDLGGSCFPPAWLGGRDLILSDSGQNAALLFIFVFQPTELFLNV